MTLEEELKKLITDARYSFEWGGSEDSEDNLSYGFVDFGTLEEKLIEILNEAILAEREACAKVAEETLRSIMVGNYSVVVAAYVSQIIRAIRERGKEGK